MESRSKMYNSDQLRKFISRVKYKPGWKIEALGSDTYYPRQEAPTPYTYPPIHIIIRVPTKDSITGRDTQVIHRMTWPDILLEPWDEKKARYWLLRMLVQIETHEACEFFKVDGRIPFFPPHGDVEWPGDPYQIRELPESIWPVATSEAASTLPDSYFHQ